MANHTVSLEIRREWGEVTTTGEIPGISIHKEELREGIHCGKGDGRKVGGAGRGRRERNREEEIGRGVEGRKRNRGRGT